MAMLARMGAEIGILTWGRQLENSGGWAPDAALAAQGPPPDGVSDCGRIDGGDALSAFGRESVPNATEGRNRLPRSQ